MSSIPKSKPVVNAIGGISIDGAPTDLQSLEYSEVDNKYKLVSGGRDYVIVSELFENVGPGTHNNSHMFGGELIAAGTTRVAVYLPHTKYQLLKMIVHVETNTRIDDYTVGLESLEAGNTGLPKVTIPAGQSGQFEAIGTKIIDIPARLVVQVRGNSTTGISLMISCTNVVRIIED